MHLSAEFVLGRLGGDASGFAARQLTSRIASTADLVITMSRDHRDSVLELAPHKLRTTFTLIEVARMVTEFGARNVTDLADLRPKLTVKEQRDIEDPIGQDPETFARIGAQISSLLPPVLELCRGVIDTGVG